VDRTRELRELAKWYRGLAKVGREEDRAWRIGFAEHLERVVAEIEFVEKCAARQKRAAICRAVDLCETLN